MNVIETPLLGVFLIEPTIFKDSRGFFYESWNTDKFSKMIGFEGDFKQDNHSYSKQNVLRGLHYQIHRPQGKLVRVVQGCVFDVAVDLRRSSPTFGKWFGAELSEDNHRQLWIPPGFAHGFTVRSESANFLYKASEFCFPEYARCIQWNDLQIGIDWDCSSPILSEKDQRGLTLSNAETYP